jgi:stress-induced morphogen
MYQVEVESAAFRGMSLLQQHKLVKEVLKADIAGMHGIQLATKVPRAP